MRQTRIVFGPSLRSAALTVVVVVLESSSTRFSPIVPLPLPVLTVTVRLAPVPLTPVIDGPETPVVASAKSDAPTPNTFWLKVTVKSTLPAFVGVAPARTIDETAGVTSRYVTIEAAHFAGLPLLFVAPA